MPTVSEAPRQVSIRAACDVIVCGGGPAGVGAAVAAARTGADTLLIETQGCLGGIWTAGLMAHVIDAEDKGTILPELLGQLETRGFKGAKADYDVEGMKHALEQLCLAAGAKIRLHTRVVGAECDTAKRLHTVLTESKSGREAWQAKAFVDCTGDGDLAALAGCGFDFGRPENGETQPMSLIVVISGVHIDQIRDYTSIRVYNEGEKWGLHKEALRQAMETAGVSPSYANPTIFHVADDLFLMMSNHEYGGSAINADDVSAATLRSRDEMHKQIAALRRLGPPWENLRIVATSAQIGTREGRRIHGRYTVNDEDLIRGARFEDVACRAYAGVDVHSTNPNASKGIETSNFKTKPYDVPLRALIAKDVDGLLMAGRCISGSFQAHSSYRMTGTAMAMGEAAGQAAAQAALAGRLPHEVEWRGRRED